MVKIILSFIATFGICLFFYVVWKDLGKKEKEKLLSDIGKSVVIGLTALIILVAIVYLF